MIGLHLLGYLGIWWVGMVAVFVISFGVGRDMLAGGIWNFIAQPAWAAFLLGYVVAHGGRLAWPW